MKEKVCSAIVSNVKQETPVESYLERNKID